MEFFRIKKDIPFMRHALIFNVVSALTFVLAVFFLLSKGLHFSIEFTGGTVMEVAYTKPANIENIRKSVEGLGFTDTQVQSFGTAQDVMIRLLAHGMVVIGIVIYLAFRFEWKFAVAAVIANLHDVVIILGFFAFFQWEFSLTVLAAVLAVLGYSVNESVVVFDRVREAFRDRRYGKLSAPEV